MRFIAKYANYALLVRPQVVEAYATGATRIVQNQLVAQFSIAITTPEERALARQLWSFNGFYQEEDLVTVREPDYRISAWDSRLAQMEGGWSDTEHDAVVQALLVIAERTPGDVIAMTEHKAAPPWPNYDSFSGNRNALLKKIQEDGYDLVEVLAYERDNQNRDEIVVALEQALVEPDTTPLPEEELVG